MLSWGVKPIYLNLYHETFPWRESQTLTTNFNQRVSKARQVIECTFDIMSNKWRLLQKGIEVEPDFVDLIVKCICLLHNIVIDQEGEQKTIGSGFQQLQSYTTDIPVRFATLGQNRSSNSA